MQAHLYATTVGLIALLDLGMQCMNVRTGTAVVAASLRIMLYRSTKRIACQPGVGGARIPRSCDANADVPGVPGSSGNECGIDPYIVLPDKSVCVDQQTLKMQVEHSAVMSMLNLPPCNFHAIQCSIASFCALNCKILELRGFYCDSTGMSVNLEGHNN